MKRISPYLAWLLLFLSLTRAPAATWYATHNGSGTTGSKALPWSVEYATGNAGVNNQIAAGDDIVFLNGTVYNCTNWSPLSNHTNILLFKITAGTPTQKIRYRSESWLGATFNGGLQIEPTATNTIFWGLTIYSANAAVTRDQAAGAGFLPAGINEYAPGCEIMHCFIHDTGHPGIGSWLTTAGKYIVGNTIMFVGINDQGNSRGSGMYLQNGTNTSTALIRGNRSIFNYTTGMKAYGNPPIWDFNFTYNDIYGCDEGGIFINQDDSPMRLPNPPIRITRNTIVKGGHLAQTAGIRFGYQTHPAVGSNGVIAFNRVVEMAQPLQTIGGWAHLTVKSNLFVNMDSKFKVYLDLAGEGSIPNSHFFDYNQYYYTNTGSVDFKILDVVKNQAQWLSETGGDANSTFNPNFPSGIDSYVYQPSYDSNFVHVSTLNWNGAATTSVDISPYFNPGDVVEIIDVQNMPQAYVTNTISGPNITLDLLRTDKRAMLGAFTITKTDTWNGLDPFVRYFILHRLALAPATVTNTTVYPLQSTITIPSDTSIKANPYPSILRVADNWGTISGLKVTISNLNHTFIDDVNIALTSPDGQTVMLMSDCGGNQSVAGKVFSFDNTATVKIPIDASTTITDGGVYLPNDQVNATDNFPVRAPPVQPYGTNMAAFLGGNPNGEWQLWITDDFNGDGGTLAGWFLTITTTNAAGTLVPPHRLLSWSDDIVGVPGTSAALSAPRTIFCNVKSSIPGSGLVAIGDGIVDDTAALQAAFDRCPTNQYVYLPSGRYRCTGPLSYVGDKRLIRGDGTNTVLVVDYVDANGTFLNMGSYSEQGTWRTNIIDIPIGATNTTWDSVNGLGVLFPGVDGVVKFSWNDVGTNSQYASMEDADGSADPVHYSANGSTKAQAADPIVRYMARITGSSGNSVFFYPPSPYYFPSNQTRSKYLYVNSLKYTGIEDLSIECGGKIAVAIGMSQGMGSWIKGVSSTQPIKAHISVQYSTLFDITECLWDGAPAYGPGQGIGLILESHVFNGKIWDNIGNSNFPAIEFFTGAANNAVMYNYFLNPQGGLAPIDNHSGHNYKNLVEGNVCYGFISDGYYSGGEYWTLFRNHFHGEATAPAFGAKKILNIGHWNRKQNIIANILGSDKTNWAPTLIQSGWNNSNTVLRRYGYPNMGNDNFTGTNATIQATNYAAMDFYVWSNMLEHANVEFGSIGTKTTNYLAGITNRTYAYSYYKDWDSITPPVWWTNAGRTNAVWPPIGPDVNGNTNVIPAMMRYHNLGAIPPPVNPNPDPVIIFPDIPRLFHGGLPPEYFYRKPNIE